MTVKGKKEQKYPQMYDWQRALERSALPAPEPPGEAGSHDEVVSGESTDSVGIPGDIHSPTFGDTDIGEMTLPRREPRNLLKKFYGITETLTDKSGSQTPILK